LSFPVFGERQCNGGPAGWQAWRGRGRTGV
jgi:hypothetical protein